MEKANFAKNGVLRLPPGFRFHPTDEELVVQYLRRKVHSLPMPVSIIPEVEVCKSDPWDLPGDVENERFFFSTREVKYPNGNRSNRATQSGYWKATGLDKQIMTYSSNKPNENQQIVVGMKKTLVFYQGKPPTGARTNWIMHEYRLATQGTLTKDQDKKQGVEKSWVLCRIFLKKRGVKKEVEKDTKEEIEAKYGNENENVEMVKTKMKPVFYDFLSASARREKTRDLNLVAAYSSSGSSGVTDAACGGYGSGSGSGSGEHEDETSGDHESSFRKKV